MNIFEASNLGYKHKNLIFWIAMIDCFTKPISNKDSILDFGCGQGLFLNLLAEIYDYRYGLGIDQHDISIEFAKQFSHNKQKNNIEFVTSDEFKKDEYQEKFDLIFCQEVLWMNQDLTNIAKLFFDLLKSDGECYLTIGCHDKNPMWEHRQKLMDKENQIYHTHNIEQIAQIFSDVGFLVGLRRLPIDGFIMYNPDKNNSRIHSFYELTKTTYEHKLLFYFGKKQRELSIDTIQA